MDSDPIARAEDSGCGGSDKELKLWAFGCGLRVLNTPDHVAAKAYLNPKTLNPRP